MTVRDGLVGPSAVCCQQSSLAVHSVSYRWPAIRLAAGAVPPVRSIDAASITCSNLSASSGVEFRGMSHE
jgi:hypothetical protein